MFHIKFSGRLSVAFGNYHDPHVSVLAVLGIVELCGASSRNKRQRQTNQDYYGQHYDSHPDYSYSQVETYDVPVEKTKCYDCDYTLYAKENKHEGFEACVDPFKGEGIVHEVECDGPCAVSCFMLLLI